MRPARPSDVLIVAHQTADSPRLIEAVSRRARRGSCTFTLLVPRRRRVIEAVGSRVDRATVQAQRRLGVAVPLLSRAAGGPVVGMLGSSEPLATIKDALELLHFDEVIISMLAPSESVWLAARLPRDVRALGIPVTEVLGVEREISGLPAA